jgi:hypothetical protein
MATYTIEFTIADEHVERIRSALRQYFGPIHESVTEEITNPETGEIETQSKIVPRELTPEELLARVRQMSIDNVKAIVTSVESKDLIANTRASIDAVVVE